jgi:hypothetical protein
LWHNDVGHVIGACASTREGSSCGCIRVCECDTNSGFCKSHTLQPAVNFSHLATSFHSQLTLHTAPQPCTSLVQHWPAFWQSQLLTLRPSSFLIQPTVGLYMGLWRGQVTPKDILTVLTCIVVLHVSSFEVSSHKCRHTDCAPTHTVLSWLRYRCVITRSHCLHHAVIILRVCMSLCEHLLLLTCSLLHSDLQLQCVFECAAISTLLIVTLICLAPS